MPVSPIVAAKINIDKKVKKDWNDYVDHLEKTGEKGSKKFDAGEGYDNAGLKRLAEYIKQNPGTSLKATPDFVRAIQQNFLDIKGAIESTGKRGAAAGPSEIFAGVSSTDGKPGSVTTLNKYPTSKYTDKLTGKVYEGGFITPTDLFPDLPADIKAIALGQMKAGESRKEQAKSDYIKDVKKQTKATTKTELPIGLPQEAPIMQAKKMAITKAQEDLGENIYGPGGSLIGFLNKNRDFVPASGDYLKGINPSDSSLLKGDVNELNKYLNLKTQGVAKPIAQPLKVQ